MQVHLERSRRCAGNIVLMTGEPNPDDRAKPGTVTVEFRQPLFFRRRVRRLEREYLRRGYELERAVRGRNRDLWSQELAETLDPEKPNARIASLVFVKRTQGDPSARNPRRRAG